MKQVEWTDAALADLNSIKTYLSTFGHELADGNVATLILAARWLLDHPGAGTVLGIGRWRKWKPRKQRYLLIYRPTESGIEVGRVRHDRHDWKPVPE